MTKDQVEIGTLVYFFDDAGFPQKRAVSDVSFAEQGFVRVVDERANARLGWLKDLYPSIEEAKAWVAATIIADIEAKKMEIEILQKRLQAFKNYDHSGEV